MKVTLKILSIIFLAICLFFGCQSNPAESAEHKKMEAEHEKMDKEHEKMKVEHAKMLEEHHQH